MTGKVTKAILAERVEKVVELLVLGLRSSEIIRYAAEKPDWDVKRRQVENYIQKATAIITQSAAVDRDHEVGKALRRLEALYKANMTIQDYKAALATLKARNEMLGLDAPKVSKVTGTITPMTWKEFIESGQQDEPAPESDDEPEADPE
jgi:hypothetical protein